MKGWTKRAVDALKICEECGKEYGPKKSWAGYYEPENHFNNSHSCSWACRAKRLGSNRTSKAEKARKERELQAQAYNQAIKKFLYTVQI